MPSRKQRRREAKSKRHEYEFVYVDDEGNEVEAPPVEETRSNGAKPAAKKSAPPARTGRMRTPQAPSWQRASRRAVLLGAVVFVLFSFSTHSYVRANHPSDINKILFIPFTYAIDRFAYKRWQQRSDQAATTKRK